MRPPRSYCIFCQGDREKSRHKACIFLRKWTFHWTNTWFQLANTRRRLYTCRSPADTEDHQVRNPINYILINRYEYSSKFLREYLEAFNPLIAVMQLHLKRSKIKKINHYWILPKTKKRGNFKLNEINEEIRQNTESTSTDCQRNVQKMKIRNSSGWLQKC